MYDCTLIHSRMRVSVFIWMVVIFSSKYPKFLGTSNLMMRHLSSWSALTFILYVRAKSRMSLVRCSSTSMSSDVRYPTTL